MQSNAKSVAEYLAELPEDRRQALTALRKLISDNIDRGFSEGVGCGMIGWSVPHSLYPPGYHCDPKQPLPFAGLASQKNYMSLYICPPGMGLQDPESVAEERWFRDAWAKSGKKLDKGISCIRFKRLDDLALDVIAEAFRRMTTARFIAGYEAARAATKPRSRAEIQAMIAERQAAADAARDLRKAAAAKPASKRAKPGAAKKVAAKKVAAKKVAAKKVATKKMAAKKAASRKK